MPGVVRTRVGYAGGTTKNPTYRNLGDHTEAIQIDYDPVAVSYEELLDVFWLDVFWNSHDPTTPFRSRQYRSILFYHNDKQKRLALESRDREATRMQKEIFTEIVPFSEKEISTEIVPFSTFYLAEAYHQKYRLQGAPILIRDFHTMYPDDDGFVSSTAAARINGYIAGYGTIERFQAELDSFGLSPKGKESLLSIMGDLHPGEVIEQCPIK
jgi:methionine-S-sulfoxide reductase